ncbi:NAD(P)/FAD-dependent oxidoreductase [Amycolatopsis rhizosphaerae]|uniref:NAD(P)/FAD-dependent oxidoreductase n=1 Tax=Amycolatopsis rhizosphaerae TaxID=2053003 RepID=A0A558CS69_9PSEU|nr:NAD(P)/FAD-dependent oxidoreductase [Amycolatopsis rhizosphaerae]TVT51532.1 NAD(P)/FAD-dependent oxidoreductase [Amycolatopsis rhizosphaerae]
MEHHPIVIIGAGFGGLGLGVRLRQAGIRDFVILERTANLGGTWSRNTYPGAACDVPSSLYSYSFAPNPGWSRKYGRQPEILDYLRRTAEDHGVIGHLRLETEVLKARFDEDTRHWHVTTGSGELTAGILVSAVGAFAEAAVPGIKGLAGFGGTIFHTLHWDHDHDLTGERVAVIGTGATAVQVVPEVQKVARELRVFQRSAPWIVPRLDRTISPVEKLAFRALPVAQRLHRGGWYAAIESFGLPGFVSTKFRHPFEVLGRLQLLRQVRDPELRARLTPDYMIGCKRAIFSDTYYPALCQDNVELVTEGIEEVRPHGIVTADGTEHEVDTIILATGFTATPALMDRIEGTGGRTVLDAYRERPQSYLGAANAGFPNMFTVLGPFGAAANQSAIYMIEGQIDYIVDAVRRLREAGYRRVEVRREAQEAFVDEVHARSGNGTWLKGGCSSYYTNGRGANSGLYPNWSFEYRRRTRRFDIENYEVSR